MLTNNRDVRLIKAIHLYQKHRDRRGPAAWVGRILGKLRYEVWSILSASDIHRDATIAADVRFPHPNGVVIHQSSVVESGCMIMQQVTLGQLATGNGPHLKQDVYVGAGAKLLGPITIGEGARIGANSVVLEDVPSFATAVGAPARIILRSDES